MRFGPVCLLAFMLAACGSARELAPSPPAVSGSGATPTNEILVYRRAEPGVSVNLATAPAILLDGRSIGTCRIAQPILIKVPKGTWAITALSVNGEVSQEVTVAEGDHADLRCGTSATMSEAPILTQVDRKTALAESGL